MATTTKFKTVDKYHSALPTDKRAWMVVVRKTVRTAAPGAEELISYNMPALQRIGTLVFYAAWKNHIGFYRTSDTMTTAKKESSRFRQLKGSFSFGLISPCPNAYQKDGTVKGERTSR